MMVVRGVPSCFEDEVQHEHWDTIVAKFEEVLQQVTKCKRSSIVSSVDILKHHVYAAKQRNQYPSMPYSKCIYAFSLRTRTH